MMTEYICKYEDVTAAMELLCQYVHRTPLMTSSSLDSMTGRKLFFKAENFQKTGSFKIRGATNAVVRIKQLHPEIEAVVADSCGNYGAAIAMASQVAGLASYIVMPETAAQCKIGAVRRYGGKTIFSFPSTDAMRKAVKDKMTHLGSSGAYIGQSKDVIAGHGTVAIEIMEQNPDIDVIVVAVGTGGLISGIATAAKAMKPTVKIVAAEPANANDCYISKQTGVLTVKSTYHETIAEGVAGNVEEASWPIIRDKVCDVITVSEDEIIAATLMVWDRCKLVIEPSAGVAVAAVLSEKFKRVRGENVAVVLCGGNVNIQAFINLT